MSKEIVVKVHEITVDGLPTNDMNGRVAFIFDGCIVTGWPLIPEEFPHLYTPEKIAEYVKAGRGAAEASDEERASMVRLLWEADGDVGDNMPRGGVTHWVEFPAPLWAL